MFPPVNADKVSTDQCCPAQIVQAGNEQEGNNDRDGLFDQRSEGYTEMLTGECQANMGRRDLHGCVDRAHEQAQQRQSGTRNGRKGNRDHCGCHGERAGNDGAEEADQHEDQESRNRQLREELRQSGDGIRGGQDRLEDIDSQGIADDLRLQGTDEERCPL